MSSLNNMDQALSNEVLFELMKSFKDDLKYFKDDMRSFKDDVDRRFQQQENRMEKGFEELKMLIRQDQEKLQKVYEAREHVQLRFTRAWGLASLLMGMFGGATVMGISKMVA